MIGMPANSPTTASMLTRKMSISTACMGDLEPSPTPIKQPVREGCVMREGPRTDRRERDGGTDRTQPTRRPCSLPRAWDIQCTCSELQTSDTWCTQERQNLDSLQVETCPCRTQRTRLDKLPAAALHLETIKVTFSCTS